MNKEEKEAIEILKDDIVAYAVGHEKYENAVKIAVNLIDKLQKENKKYIDIFNSTEKIMNGQERTKDKLLKENVELQKENKELKENNKELVEINNKYNDMKYITRIAMLYVSKDKIRDKIKELEEELIQNYGTLGESLTTTEIKTLKELLGE